jgi:NADPH-dependent ferric siderophore reductase
MSRARVSGVQILSEHFRLINFEGEELKDSVWAAGQKLQIKLDGGLITRTYTPMEWDSSRGATRILAYAHGAGPGSDWVRAVAVGSERQIFGPRGSLDLDGLPQRVTIFGDETSFGLAIALSQRMTNGPQLRCVFEVTSRTESEQVLGAFDLGAASIIERRADESHLSVVNEALLQDYNGMHFVLTGKAASIQRVSRALKGQGIERRRLSTKVYWAPGKTGLD